MATERNTGKTAVLRSGRALVLALTFINAACTIPRFSSSTAPPGALRIQDAETGSSVPDPLILVVKTSTSGFMDSGNYKERRYVSQAFLFDARKDIVLSRESNSGVLFWARTTNVQGFVVVAPGYRPKYFYCQKRKQNDSSVIKWPLASLSADEAISSLDAMRDAINGERIEHEVMNAWDAEHEKLKSLSGRLWLNPNWPIQVDLSAAEKRLVLEYLDRAAEVLLEQGGLNREYQGEAPGKAGDV